MTKKPTLSNNSLDIHYDTVFRDIANVIDVARRSAARSLNCIMTAAYWLIGERIVETEQRGERRAAYGEELLVRLSADLIKRYGRGFSRQNLQQMRQFYIFFQPEGICQTPSGKSATSSKEGICQTPSGILQTAGESILADIARCFPLPWSAYVRTQKILEQRKSFNSPRTLKKEGR